MPPNLSTVKKSVKKKKKKRTAPELPKVESLSRYVTYDDYERKLLSAAAKNDWVTVHVRFRLSIRDDSLHRTGAGAGANAQRFGSSFMSPNSNLFAAVGSLSGKGIGGIGVIGSGGSGRTSQPCDFKVRLPATTPLSTIARRIAERHGPLSSLILTRKATDNQPLALHLTLRELDFDSGIGSTAAIASPFNPLPLLIPGGTPSLLSAGSGAGGAVGSSAAAVVGGAEREIWFDFDPAIGLQSPLLLTDPCLYSDEEIRRTSVTAVTTVTAASAIATATAAAAAPSAAPITSPPTAVPTLIRPTSSGVGIAKPMPVTAPSTAPIATPATPLKPGGTLPGPSPTPAVAAAAPSPVKAPSASSTDSKHIGFNI